MKELSGYLDKQTSCVQRHSLCTGQKIIMQTVSFKVTVKFTGNISEWL